jgi:hypothetical protein
MKIPEMFKKDDAVSPVIGVILMVAITVNPRSGYSSVRIRNGYPRSIATGKFEDK